MKTKRLLITGATGAIGLEILQQLVDKNSTYPIRVLARDTKRSRKVLRTFSKQIDIHYGDIQNEEEVKKACFQVDIVIHLAAVIPTKKTQYTDSFESINFEGTKNVVDSNN